MSQPTFTFFVGHTRLVSGTIEEVVETVVHAGATNSTEPTRLYEDQSGRAIDLDWQGTADEVLERLRQHPVLAPLLGPARPANPGPGRPRLGVVSREVSLLPRHWDWLAEQRGGASAALRRLVDEARKRSRGDDETRRALEATHRFMWDMAGNLDNFEEASRLLFALDVDSLRQAVADWPGDVRDYFLRRVAAIPRRRDDD